MATLTIRLPEEKQARLRALARQRGLSLNRLMDKLSTMALVEYDMEMRFRALAARGSPKAGFRILDKLNRLHEKETRSASR